MRNFETPEQIDIQNNISYSESSDEICFLYTVSSDPMKY
jgi:hypothetical protein